MPLITFLPSEKTVDVKAGTEISDAARYAGVDIAAPCGGEGTCGKCIIEIKSGNADFSSITIDKKYNLACKTKVLDEPLTIFVPEPIESKNGKFSDSLSDIDLIDPALLPDENNRKPVISFYEVNVPLPQNEDGLSDLDRLFRSLKDTGITETIQMPLSLLRSLTNIIREKEGHINLTLSLKR
nr:2Fe-2S iron-sulfur cluster binding domain-containing protein [Deltaproteobacteria bacterium]